ncbi:MAG: hypothetical protein ACRC6M_10610, partial [Microcystaceae cyanobacterium]
LESASITSNQGHLNLYLESYEPSPEQQGFNSAIALASLCHWVEGLACFQELMKAANQRV